MLQQRKQSPCAGEITGTAKSIANKVNRWIYIFFIEMEVAENILYLISKLYPSWSATYLNVGSWPSAAPASLANLTTVM